MKFKEILFTMFYAGYFPKAPGTAGTVVALAIYVLERIIVGPQYSWIANLFLVLFLFYPCFKLGDEAEEFYNEKDPQTVVIDEAMGFWIGILFFSFNWKTILAGFVIFRLIDIFKPYPVNAVQDIKGGAGIMLDDYIAGLYTNLILLAAALLTKIFMGTPVFPHILF